VSLTGVEQDASWRRLSARMLLIQPVQALGRYIPVLLGLVFLGRSLEDGQWWWGPLGVVAVISLSVLRWATTRYRITPEQVQLRTGLLHRRTTATPLDRVRTVDVTASVLHRVLGLAKVDIGTGSQQLFGSGLSLDSLPAAAAAALRAELLHRSAAASFDAPAAVALGGGTEGDATAPEIDDAEDATRGDTKDDTKDDTELARLDLRWVRFAPFTMSGVLGAAAILGIGSRLLDQFDIKPDEVGAVNGALEYVQRTPIWLDVVAGLVAFAVFVVALSIGGYLLSYWGFRLSRHARGTLHVTRGLLTTRATSIEERRLRGVELSEPLLLRAVHAARLSGITTGLKSIDATDGGSSLLLPPAPRTVARDVATQILRDPAPLDVQLTAHGPAARRRCFVRALFAAFVLVTAAGVAIWFGAPQWLWLPAIATIPVAVMLAADRYRSLGHALVGGYLVARQGSPNRRRAVLECDGIIGWNLGQTFFQRRAGLASLTATTAAGGQGYTVVDVPLPIALSLGSRALPGLLGEFLEPDPVPAPSHTLTTRPSD
jgi:putative membrane protein